MARLRRFLGFAAAIVWVCALNGSQLHAQTSCSSATFVYVNNNVSGANSVSAFCVGSGGSLTAVTGSPFATGGSGSGAALYGSNSIAATVVGNYLYASDYDTNDIAAFSINTSTGALTPVPGSPFAYGSVEGESNPSGISLAISPNGQFLYAGDSGYTVNSVVTADIWGFRIAANGALSPLQNSPLATIASPGVPDGMNVTRDGNYLAVGLDGELAIAMFSIGSNGILTAVDGSPFPTGGSANGMAYAEINCASNLIFGSQYSLGPASISVQTISSGALASITNSPFTFGPSGTDSNVGVLSPNDNFLFVSNQLSNTIMSLGVAANGSVSQEPGSPFCNSSNTADCVPSSTVGPMVPTLLATNQAGTLLYVANSNSSGETVTDNTVSAFSISASGVLTLISGSPFDTAAAGQPSIAVFPPKVCSTLSVSKTPAPSSATYGNPIGFVIGVSNAPTAQATATNVSLSDPLPGGSAVTWSITSSTAGSCSISFIDDSGNQALSCAVGSLAPGQSGNVRISGAGAAVGAYQNTAAVSASPPNASSLTSSATATVTQATPAFSLTPSQTILVGTASINLSGTISAPGPVFPPVEESVSITIDDRTQTATIGENGAFSLSFPTSNIPASTTPYTIAYGYAGDNNFASATNTSTTLTVSSTTVETLSLTLFGTGTGAVTDNSSKINCSEMNGTGQTGTCGATYSGGTMVTLTAAATSPSTFGGWGGACANSGTSPTCNLTLDSNVTVTANFVPPPAFVNLTFPVGTNSTQTATFSCPSNTHPCTDPNASQVQFTVPTVSSTFGVTVMTTEVPPLDADGLCEVGHTVNNDFDCRFVTFFGDGLDPSGNTIVPLCVPYANGNCIHYLVYSGTPGNEPPTSSYSGGVSWVIRYNNSSFVPGSYWTGSTPQFYDDPDYAPFPNSAVGTSCTTPMTINGVPQTYFCQFEYNITTFFDPNETVDSGIGGHTKQFNDVVIAFPPTTEGSGTVVSPPPVPAAPMIAGSCIMGCTTTSSTITFAINTGGTFLVNVTGYPPPTLTESGALPAGLSFNSLTGILGGTPTSGVNGNFPISFTASNGVGSVTLNFTVTVGQLAFSSSAINLGDAFPGLPVVRTLTITNAGPSAVTFTHFSIAPISGDDSSGFFDLSLCPKTLDAGKNCDIILVFTANSDFSNTHAANLVIADNVPGSPQTVPMSVNVVPASLSTLILNFGNQKKGSTSPAKSVTLKNIGTAPLTLPVFSIRGEFAFAPSSTCLTSKSLAPQATCAIGLTFKPVSKGPALGSVMITQNPFVVLTGNGD